MTIERVLFARVGWMKLYKGQQPDDEKPIGGGKFNQNSVGHEAFNFLPIKSRVLGYFQPQLQPRERRKLHPSSINLGRIEPGLNGDTLDNVLVIFDSPTSQVGWAVHHRLVQERDSSSQSSEIECERTKFLLVFHRG